MSLLNQQDQSGYVFGMGAVLLWSGFILVSRLGGISELNHYDVVALRYATCALIVLPIWWFKFRFNVFQWRYVAAALVGGLGYALCTFHGFQLAPASHGALLLPGAMPLFIFLLALSVGQAKLNMQSVFSVAVISAGILILFFGQVSNQQVDASILMGDGLFLLGAFFWGVFSILIKRWGLSPWQVTISMALLTSIMYLPFYIMFAPKNIALHLWPEMGLQMFYQGFLATIVQMLLYVRAVALIGASGMGALMALVPLIAGVAALILFDEPATVSLLIGLLCVALGAWLNHSPLLGKYLSSGAVLKTQR
ncbi:MAG: DMT family transporter [Gammaproteobacteria bacterium]|nr:DMT family transporter [Gammaproteobacteria bacterium]